MTVTNTSDRGTGSGIRIIDAKVVLIDVALKGCSNAALYIQRSTSETTVVATRCVFANSNNGVLVRGSLTSATFKNCVFHDNKHHGMYAANNATIHLHGETTAVHSNKRHGIYAICNAKVVIHLPSHHNTTYNNGGEDRETFKGGTITNV